MKRYLLPLLVVGLLVSAAPADAQTLGTFRWRLGDFCSVLNLTVTQLGSVFTLAGHEEQCGGNPRLPVYGAAIVQENNTQVWMGLTTIFDFGNGLHTQATVDLATLNGFWRDNANQTGTLVFNPGPITSGGPRITPIEPDELPSGAARAGAAGDASVDALRSEVADLKRLVAELMARQR